MVVQLVYASENVGGNVVLSRDGSYIGSELGYEIEMDELPLSTFFPLLLQSVGDGLIVGEYNEVARFQHVTEMRHGLADGQQLSVICAVFLLNRAEFLGEGEGLPGVLARPALFEGPVEIRRPGDCITTFDSGAGQVMKWCFGSSGVGQKSPVEVEHAHEAEELTGGLGRRADMKMGYSFFQRLETLGGHLITKEGGL
jgi:hypothetical protein